VTLVCTSDSYLPFISKSDLTLVIYKLGIALWALVVDKTDQGRLCNEVDNVTQYRHCYS
jgi:hypothetical protein